MKAALYARVSTTDRQKPETQLRKLREYAERRDLTVVDEWIDRASGRKDTREALSALLGAARRRDVDVIIVAAYDRLSRSLRELVNTVAELEALGVDLVSLREGTDTTTPQGRLLFGFMATLAEFESALIGERVRAGLDRARAQGKTLGRPRIPDRSRDRMIELRFAGKSLRVIGADLGVGHSTVARTVRAYEQEHGVIVAKKTDRVELSLRIENNSKFVRGKKRSREEIEKWVLAYYGYEKPDKSESVYILDLQYSTEAELDRIVEDIMSEASGIADDRHCFVEADARSLLREDRYW